MVYIAKSFVEELCSSFASMLSEACWVTYDMINPTDIFGRTMLRNLTNAGFNVPGFTDFPTLDRQIERFTQNGWTAARSRTMLQAFNGMIDAAEKRRIAGLEIFDELEEWNLLMSHYSLTVGLLGSQLAELLDEIPSS
jgi:hypothetical protein